MSTHSKERCLRAVVDEFLKDCDCDRFTDDPLMASGRRPRAHGTQPFAIPDEPLAVPPRWRSRCPLL